MDDAQALLTRLYDAYNRRDFAAASALLTLDVDWPDQLQGGRIVGREALAAYWTTNDRSIRVDAAPVAFTALPDGRIAVDVNLIVRNPAGRVWSDSRARQVFTLRDGQVARMEEESPGKEPRS